MLLHLTIFYEYQQFFFNTDTATTSTRKCTQTSAICRHKTSHMVLSIIFLKTSIQFYSIYQYVMSANSFFNIVSVSRCSRPITVTGDTDQRVPPVFFLIMLFNNVSTEILTSGWVMLSRINSPAAEINCQSTYITYINIHLEKKC